MTVPSTSIERPYSDSYLLTYSAEHVAYEFDMFFWLADVCNQPLGLGALTLSSTAHTTLITTPCSNRSLRLEALTPADEARLNNVLIEAFFVHLRNVIDFVYPVNVSSTDVVAADFFAPNGWDSQRPLISSTLKAARLRANKEIAHLTTRRIAGSPPAKDWNFQGLANEIRPLIRLMSAKALATRLSSKVAAAIQRWL